MDHSPSRPPPPDPYLERLRQGEIELTGEFVWGSNYTFLTRVVDAEGEFLAVYKPSRGEQPLWDFPEGTLAAREAAAYVTSQALGWGLVPPTILRPDGPAGPGSLQLYVEAVTDRHYFTMGPEEKQRLRPVAAFDLLINNADRKGGHVLVGRQGELWLIDHGVSFHHEDKLRTVIWDFAGEAIPAELLKDIHSFRDRLRLPIREPGSLSRELGELISRAELAALGRRADRLLADPCFPEPGSDRPYPWPMV
jgi:uncharacterized repeat protein (TIGR03843 family)